MNIVSLINVDNVNDIPNALRALANIVETDVSARGEKANSIGVFGKIDGVSGYFDYQIENTNHQSLCGYLKK
jgi:hypothetical protein